VRTVLLECELGSTVQADRWAGYLPHTAAGYPQKTDTFLPQAEHTRVAIWHGQE